MGVVCNTNIEEIFENECLSDSLLKINNNFLNLESSVCELRQRVDSQVEVRTFFYYGPNATSNPTSGMDEGGISRPSDMTIQAFVNSPTELNLPAISKPRDVAYITYQKTGFLTSNNLNAPAGSIVSTRGIISRGARVSLKYGIWYDVEDYFSAVASCDGAPGRLGTITLSFRPSVGASTTPFVYRASGNRADDTYVEWNENSVIFSEGYPIPKTVRRTQARPFRSRETAQFRFDIQGNVISKSITAIPKIVTPITGRGNTARITNNVDVNNQFSPTFIIWRLTCQDSMFYTVDTGFPKFSRAQQSASGNASTWNNPQSWSQY